MTDIHGRIRATREEKGLSRKAFGTAIGVSEAKVQALENGRQRVDHPVLEALSRNLGVDVNWLLLGGDNHHSISQPDFIQVPRLSLEASAGPGALVDNELQTGFYAFNRKWLARRHLSPENLSVIAVRGDSMEPRLSDGDLILVDRAQKRIADGIAYVLRIDTDLLVKNVQRVRPGVIALLSANALYPPREIETGSLEDASPKAEVEIIGRVVASMHEW